MPDRFPLSWLGAVLALAYATFATLVVLRERAPGRGGDWISLRGMASAIVTAPISLPMEMLGRKLDHKRNRDMAFAIVGCAVLVYLLGAGIAWIGNALVQLGRV